MVINQKYAATEYVCEPGNTQFPGVRSAISGLRYYSPTLGRFINQDPIEEKGGLNLYTFCGNNGVNRWDLLGMDPPTIVWSQTTWEAVLAARMTMTATAR